MKFKIGDIVKINPKSYYYSVNNMNNPANTPGIVIHSEEMLSVKWNNGKTNSYSDADLVYDRSADYKLKTCLELKYAIYCDSQEEYTQVLSFLESQDIKWGSGGLATSKIKEYEDNPYLGFQEKRGVISIHFGIISSETEIPAKLFLKDNLKLQKA